MAYADDEKKGKIFPSPSRSLGLFASPSRTPRTASLCLTQLTHTTLFILILLRWLWCTYFHGRRKSSRIINTATLAIYLPQIKFRGTEKEKRKNSFSISSPTCFSLVKPTWSLLHNIFNYYYSTDYSDSSGTSPTRETWSPSPFTHSHMNHRLSGRLVSREKKIIANSSSTQSKTINKSSGSSEPRKDLILLHKFHSSQTFLARTTSELCTRYILYPHWSVANSAALLNSETDRDNDLKGLFARRLSTPTIRSSVDTNRNNLYNSLVFVVGGGSATPPAPRLISRNNPLSSRPPLLTTLTELYYGDRGISRFRVCTNFRNEIWTTICTVNPCASHKSPTGGDAIVTCA